MFKIVTRRGVTGMLAAGALAVGIAAVPLQQAMAAADFSGKKVRIIVPFSEGGGTDSLTRALVPYMEKYLPGKPKILVVNKPGAGGIVGGNYFESKAPKDGTWVMALSISTVMNYLLRDPRVKFEIKDWEPIILLPRGNMMYARTELGLKGLDSKAFVKQLRSIPTEKLVFGGKTPTSTDLNKRMAFSLLGVEVKNVWGMKGNGPMAQAFERGEFTLNYDNSLSYLNNRKGFRKSGISTELFTWGAPDANGDYTDVNGKYYRDPTWPDVPTFYEIYEQGTGGKFDTPEAKATLAAIRVGIAANKAYLLPKGADKDAVAAWRNALRKTIADPDFATKKEKILGKYNVTLGEAAGKALRAALILSTSEKAYIKKYVKSRYDLDLKI